VDGDPCAGHLFIQGEVRRGKATGLFDDVVGRGFTLLSPVGDPARRLAPDLAAFFASLLQVAELVQVQASTRVPETMPPARRPKMRH